jgi:dTDP-4-dehydrorhamnose 3,5-epimerase
MRFLSTSIEGVLLIDSEPAVDARGFFARLFGPQEFAANGIQFAPVQISLSHNHAVSTLRGLHYCTEPEAKIVYCTRGRIYDVVLDLRSNSSTFGHWLSFELVAGGERGLFIPAGVAHGFLTMEPNCDVLYQIDRLYDSMFAAGVRWNDQAFNIYWPSIPNVMSSRDATYADFDILL